MITNKTESVQLKMREARFWPKMKFEPIFFLVLWRFFNPKGSLLRAGGRGSGGNSAPPYIFWAKSVRIFSKAHRHSENWGELARIRQPIFPLNWNFFIFAPKGLAKSGLPEFSFLIFKE